MSFLTAKDDKYLYVLVGIGNKSKKFQCKEIEELENGFRLKNVDKYDEDVLINNASVLITYQDLADEWNM